MSRLRLASWNVNGLRSIAKKGFYEWLEKEQPEIVGLQETKISLEQIQEEMKAPPGYVSIFNCAERRGYSGVALYSKERPLSVKLGMDSPDFDREGRVITADFGDFTLLNIYFPNGSANVERLIYKMGFYNAFAEYAARLEAAGHKLIICGDFNTAHKAIDLARPKANENISGFLPEERAWLDKFVQAGYADTFRHFNPDPHNYTWWHMRSGARARNVGWRIDYFFVSMSLVGRLHHATIEPHILGSDHCPVTLTLSD